MRAACLDCADSARSREHRYISAGDFQVYTVYRFAKGQA